jgi:hypothetical protein
MLMEEDINNTLTIYSGVFDGHAGVCFTTEANGETTDFKIDNEQDIDALISYLKTMKKELILTTEFLIETGQHSDFQPPEIKLATKPIVN